MGATYRHDKRDGIEGYASCFAICDTVWVIAKSVRMTVAGKTKSRRGHTAGGWGVLLCSSSLFLRKAYALAASQGKRILSTTIVGEGERRGNATRTRFIGAGCLQPSKYPQVSPIKVTEDIPPHVLACPEPASSPPINSTVLP